MVTRLHALFGSIIDMMLVVGSRWYIASIVHFTYNYIKILLYVCRLINLKNKSWPSIINASFGTFWRSICISITIAWICYIPRDYCWNTYIQKRAIILSSNNKDKVTSYTIVTASERIERWPHLVLLILISIVQHMNLPSRVSIRLCTINIKIYIVNPISHIKQVIRKWIQIQLFLPFSLYGHRYERHAKLCVLRTLKFIFLNFKRKLIV